MGTAADMELRIVERPHLLQIDSSCELSLPHSGQNLLGASRAISGGLAADPIEPPVLRPLGLLCATPRTFDDDESPGCIQDLSGTICARLMVLPDLPAERRESSDVAN